MSKHNYHCASDYVLKLVNLYIRNDDEVDIIVEVDGKRGIKRIRRNFRDEYAPDRRIKNRAE